MKNNYTREEILDFAQYLYDKTTLGKTKQQIIEDWEAQKAFEMFSKKPPLGLIPLIIDRERRYNEVQAAIKRYKDAGLGVPKEWIAEEQTLYSWLQADEPKEKEVVYPTGILSFIDWQDGKIWKYEKEADLSYNDFCVASIGDKQIIWSVKNNAGEVLTVGDQTNCGKIKKFWFGIVGYDPDSITLSKSGNRIIAILDSTMKIIDDVHPVKKYKTEDGYDINQTIGYWIVSDDFRKRWVDGGIIHEKKSSDKHFMLAENAEKYIRMNKPRYSKQQILDAEIKIVEGENIRLAIYGEEVFPIDKTKLGL